MSTNDRFLPIRDAARYLGCHPQTLRRWTREGHLPSAHVTARGDRRSRANTLRRVISSRSELPTTVHRDALDVRVSGSTGQETSRADQGILLRTAAEGGGHVVVAVGRDPTRAG